MQLYVNNTSIPLSMAVFLATDSYDREENTISATALIKPIRQAILASRIPPQDSLVDISALVKSRIGTAIHDGIERSWKDNYKNALSALGYPKKVIERMHINPEPDELKEDTIPVYMEQRKYRDIAGVRVSGKYDFVGDGRLEDFKSTSTFTYVKGTKDEDYVLQGSIYRWLDPECITQDVMAITFIFTDWQAARARQDPAYPPSQILQKTFKLMSEAETEAYILGRLALHARYKDAPEDQIPLCTDKELWRSEPAWKYYKNPEKMSRSTKNFDNKQEAMARLAADKFVGKVVEVPGQVTACKYCAAFPICSQKDQLIAAGQLQL